MSQRHFTIVLELRPRSILVSTGSARVLTNSVLAHLETLGVAHFYRMVPFYPYHMATISRSRQTIVDTYSAESGNDTVNNILNEKVHL